MCSKGICKEIDEALQQSFQPWHRDVHQYRLKYHNLQKFSACVFVTVHITYSAYVTIEQLCGRQSNVLIAN